MTDDELDRFLVSGRRFSDRAVDELPISGSARALMEEIMATPVLASGADSEPPEHHPRRGWRRAAVAAVAAVAAASLAFVWWPKASGDQAFATAAVAVAEANPRLLLDKPGWSIERVDTFGVVDGEMTFTDGTHRLDVHWYAAESYESYYVDRLDVSDPTDMDVLGTTGARFQYGDSADYATMLPPQGANFLEVRGDLGNLEAYEDILGALHRVDVDTWLSAMPDSVVKPSDRSIAVAEMLTGVPVPDGFDPTALEQSVDVSDEYQLGAQVAGAVVCSWYSRWSEATAAGDAAGVTEAVEAVKSATTWPVLLDMNEAGDYPEAVWEYADRMAVGTLQRVDLEQGLGCGHPPRDAYLN